MAEFQKFISSLKEILFVFREIILIFIFVLLILFPKFFNSILKEAGFTKGNIAGFEWSGIEKSAQETKEASQQVAQIDEKLQGISVRIDSLSSTTTDPEVKKNIEDISRDVQSSLAKTGEANAVLKKSLIEHENIMQQYAPESIEETGWLFLGKINEAKNKWHPGNPKNIRDEKPSLEPGALLTIAGESFLRGESTPSTRAGAPVRSVLRNGESVEILEKDFSHAQGGGWFVWVKVKRNR